MPHEEEISSILRQVMQWPSEDRVALTSEILRSIQGQARRPPPRNTVDLALGIARGKTAPPDDETVEKWMEDHRLRKHH